MAEHARTLYNCTHCGYDYKECLVVSDKQSIEKHFKRQHSSTSSTSAHSVDGEPKEKVQHLGSDIPCEQISPQLNAELKVLKDGQTEILRLLKTNKQTTAPSASVVSVIDKCSGSRDKTVGDDSYLSSVIKNARTVDQLVTSLDCIIYSEDGRYVHYFLCSESKAMTNTEPQSTSTTTESDFDSNIPEFTSAKGWFHIPKPSEKSEKSDFYHLKDHIKRHLLSNHHKYNESKSKPETVKKQKRDYHIGMRLGSLAYEIVYRAQAFSTFPEKVAWLSQTGVDVGSTNHKCAFHHRHGA